MAVHHQRETGGRGRGCKEGHGWSESEGLEAGVLKRDGTGRKVKEFCDIAYFFAIR